MRQSNGRRNAKQFWLIIAACGFVVAILAACVFYVIPQYRLSQRWSGFPHTMGCDLDTTWKPAAGEVLRDPPNAGYAESVTVEHPSDQALSVAIAFRGPVDPLRLAYSISVEGAKLSAGEFKGQTSTILILSDADGMQTYDFMAGKRNDVRWSAHRVEVSAENNLKDRSHDSGPRRNDPNLLTAIDVERNVATFTITLAGQSEFLGSGPFEPAVNIRVMWEIVPPGAGDSSPQICHWNTAASGSADHNHRQPPTVPSVETPRADQSVSPRPLPSVGATSPVPGSATNPLPDADGHGFVGYGGGRCADQDFAVALGRTEQSLVAICQTSSGETYYEGFGFRNGLAIHLDKALHYNAGYTINNADVQYTVTPNALEVDQNTTVLSREPMLEYWSR